ncbi:phosphotransferase [Microbacterium sp. MYb66]|uniref:phosphotransferase n=1 Tax=Microbacterium sp. MYb66 TaxID=1848692 RepID=UPI0021582C43|nr:phosphotransferase [Microbacterium sp. MYb66]
MGRSPFTLAAAVTAALPGAEVTGARSLSADGDARFDSAIASLADGRELAIRVADDDETARELAAEAIALRALTDGARAMLPFRAPAYIGETRIGEGRALVTELLPGFQIEAALVPAGRGAAESMGASIAAVHGLPTSVVRGAGLATRSAEESRAELERLVDTAAATGKVPARLTVRWRDAVADDELWRFESTVILGGVQATSFLFEDDPDRGPEVIGLVGWHGLSVGDPALDLSWLSAAPDAAADVHAAYARAIDRAPDGGLEVRARLLAELEFARWLVHGDSMHRPDIVDDAAALLEALADGLHNDDLSIIDARGAGVDSALDALDRVPKGTVSDVDTSMHTDAYNPEELWAEGDEDSGTAPTDSETSPDESPAGGSTGEPEDDRAHRAEMLNVETEDLSGVASLFSGPRGSAGVGEDSHPLTPGTDHEYDSDDSDEAQRAARAALQRWKSSSSE